VASFYKDISTNSLESLADAGLSSDEQKQVSRLLADADAFLDIGDLKSARPRLESALKIYPQHTPSRLNLAKCILMDTSLDVRERCDLAVKYCQNVKNHELDPQVSQLIQGIAFDIASLAKESTNGLETLELFKQSMLCCESFSDRDHLISDFVSTLYDRFIHRIQNEITNQKRSFCPTMTDIDLAISLSRFDESAKAFCLTLYSWIADNEKFMHRRSIARLDALRVAAGGFYGDYVHYSVGLLKVSSSYRPASSLPK